MPPKQRRYRLDRTLLWASVEVLAIACATALGFSCSFWIAPQQALSNGQIIQIFQLQFMDHEFQFSRPEALPERPTVTTATTQPYLGSLIRSTTYEGPRAGRSRTWKLCVNLWLIVALLACLGGVFRWRQRATPRKPRLRRPFSGLQNVCIVGASAGLLLCLAILIATRTQHRFSSDITLPRWADTIDGFPTRLTLANVGAQLSVGVWLANPVAFQSGTWKTQGGQRNMILGGLIEHNASAAGSTYAHTFRSDLWFPAACSGALLLAAIIWVVRSRRIRARDACRNCGYDLAGNESGTCPECGTPLLAATQDGPPSE